MRTVMRRARQPALTSNDHRARKCNRLNDSELDIAGARREIENQIF